LFSSFLNFWDIITSFLKFLFYDISIFILLFEDLLMYLKILKYTMLQETIVSLFKNCTILVRLRSCDCTEHGRGFNTRLRQGPLILFTYPYFKMLLVKWLVWDSADVNEHFKKIGGESNKVTWLRKREFVMNKKIRFFIYIYIYILVDSYMQGVRQIG
jgi:hypothetical protein